MLVIVFAASAATLATTNAGSTAANTAGTNPLVYVLMVLQVVTSVGLIVFVLLHSGKGTGLSSMLGGVTSGSSGTAVIEKNLDRITIGLAIAWAVCSLLLMIAYRPLG
jgi:preprotein translocase subunit SecG